MDKSWWTKDFICVLTAIIEEICGSCEVKGKLEDDALVSFFLERLNFVASNLGECIHKKQKPFGCKDLPALLYIGWLVSCWARRIKKKLKRKRAVSLLLIGAMREAHVAQHEEWGESEWCGDIPPAMGISAPLVAGICAREYQEALTRIDGSPRGKNDIAELYKILTDFLQLQKGVTLFPDLSHKLIPDPYAIYLWELPKRTCPRCGRQSYPTIAHDKPFNITQGFHFQCQFCGQPYGPGGLVKPLRKKGRRVLSTVWSSGRFEIEECEFCGRSRQLIESLGMHLESHHIRPVCENGRDIPSNIMLLCSECHAEAHRRRNRIKGKH